MVRKMHHYSCQYYTAHSLVVMYEAMVDDLLDRLASFEGQPVGHNDLIRRGCKVRFVTGPKQKENFTVCQLHISLLDPSLSSTAISILISLEGFQLKAEDGKHEATHLVCNDDSMYTWTRKEWTMRTCRKKCDLCNPRDLVLGVHSRNDTIIPRKFWHKLKDPETNS